MITKEEWDRIFERTMPLVSLGIGTISVALGLMAISKAGPLGRRIYYQDGYLVSVRYGDWHDLRDFVQPDNPEVVAIYSQIGPDFWALYDWVCRNIDYRRDIGEFWQTPSETLAKRRGDCEDTSLLLCSLFQNVINTYVALGSFQGYGHAWCQLNGQIFETTFTFARLVSNPQDYCPYVCFNDQEVLELWPGALDEVFKLERDESTKLNLIAEALYADGSHS